VRKLSIVKNQTPGDRREGDRRKVSNPEPLAILYFRKGLDILQMSESMANRWSVEVVLGRKIIEALERDTTNRIERRVKDQRARKAAA
jgi:hypothetical protein